MRNGPKTEFDHMVWGQLPQEAKAKISTVEVAKASDLRSVAKIAFAQLLGAKPEKYGGGVWFYTGRLFDEDVCVEIDYGSMRSQIRYNVRLLRMWQKYGAGPTYEELLGFGHGWWDQIEKNQEDQTFAVLREVVVETVRMCLAMDEKAGKMG